MNYPLFIFIFCILAMWLAAQGGAWLRRRRSKLEEGEKDYLGVILGADLTLLGLIIGFTFSMATSRYDQRKNYEEAEANAIGTEYVRAGLLPSSDAIKVRNLLKSYLEQRILFYTTRDTSRLVRINASTTQLQCDLWTSVQAPSLAQPTPLAALAVAGMNDVLNSQGYTQAAWWNRIPIAAWTLMVAIGVCCNALLGYTARIPTSGNRRFVLLPLIVSVSFFLIADLDSPTGGGILVSPHNLVSLASSLCAQ